MNEKTATLINAVAGSTGGKSAAIKKTWRLVPWNKRNKLRRQFEAIVDARKANER